MGQKGHRRALVSIGKQHGKILQAGPRAPGTVIASERFVNWARGRYGAAPGPEEGNT